MSPRARLYYAGTIIIGAVSFWILDVWINDRWITAALWALAAGLFCALAIASGFDPQRIQTIGQLQTDLTRCNDQSSRLQKELTRAQKELVTVGNERDRHEAQLEQELSENGKRKRRTAWLMNNDMVATRFDELIGDLKKARDEAAEAEAWLRSTPLGARAQASRVRHLIQKVDEFTDLVNKLPQQGQPAS